MLTAVEKGDSGRRKKRLAEDNRLSPATIAKRVSVAKQVFHAAVEWDWIVKNPFIKLRTGSQANPKRACYVPLATILDVLHACPSMEWKLIVALSRLAGLRCPSEIRGLTWDNINWEKGRLTVLARKMEHHGGDHAVRFVPLCPELRAIFAEAFEPGATLIVPMATPKKVNLRTHLLRIIKKAGHKPWPKLFQNLRASREADWVDERYPLHVTAKWMGHSPKVAAQHYLMAREHHFEAVVRGDTAIPTATPGAFEAAANRGADCSSLAVQNCVQLVPAPGGMEPHETTEPAAAQGVAAGSSDVCPVSKTGLMAGTGFEPVTSRL